MTSTANHETDLVAFQVRNFPLPLKTAIIREAKARGTSMNDVVVAVLAEEFGIPFTPQERPPSVPAARSTLVAFSMPRALRIAIRTSASSKGIPARTLALAILSQHFVKGGH